MINYRLARDDREEDLLLQMGNAADCDLAGPGALLWMALERVSDSTRALVISHLADVLSEEDIPTTEL